jgi:predicted DNA-binding transcriptional regulator YafY
MTRAQAQLRRLYWIDAALQRGEYPNAPGLAQELGVSRTTLHQDLRALRETYRAPLTFDPTKGGYGYGHPFRPELPHLPAEEAIDLATTLLRRGQLADSALGDSLRRLRESLGGLLPAGDAAAAGKPAVVDAGAMAAGARSSRTASERGTTRSPGARRAGTSGAVGSGTSERVSILVRFDPAATRAVLDSGFFAPHDVQLLTNGGFEATVTTDDPDAFLLSLLQWAPHFAVAGPPWARRRLPQLLRRLVRQLEERKASRRKR